MTKTQKRYEREMRWLSQPNMALSQVIPQEKVKLCQNNASKAYFWAFNLSHAAWRWWLRDSTRMRYVARKLID